MNTPLAPRGTGRRGARPRSNLLPERWDFSVPASGTIVLVCPREMNATVMTVIARTFPRVIDCGNRFNAYTLARLVGANPEVMDRISVARAFTCHQVLALLADAPATAQPFVVLDLLNTFYDEAIRLGERMLLLRGCIEQLRRLERSAGGLVSVHPPAVPSQAALDLLSVLERAIPQTYYAQPPAPLVEQMRLI
jgi:hypothetical protein